MGELQVSRDERRRLTELWERTFDATVVITTDGSEVRLQRLLESVPFDPALLRIDRCPVGQDCLTGRPEENHHVIVGNRHKRIVEQTARAGLKNVCVLEDDAEFVCSDADVIASVLEWVRGHSTTWGVFYLGFGAPFLTRCSYVTRHIIRTHRPFFAHALCYNRQVYEQILAIDFAKDHRPMLFRSVERMTAARQRESAYFRDGVGSLDTWLSFSNVRRYAAYPLLVVQTALPPGTERAWKQKTGRTYDVRVTPGEQVRIALAVHYGLWAVGVMLFGMAVLFYG